MRRKPTIQANYVPFSLSGGIDTKNDPHLVQPPNTLQATNMRYTTSNAIRRRAGTTAASLPSSATTSIVGASNNESLAADVNGAVQAFNPTTGQWLARGQGTPLQIKTQQTIQMSQASGSVWTQLRDVSTAQIGNIGMAVWDNGASTTQKYAGQVSIVCYDVSTGKQYWSVYTSGIALLSTAAYRIYGATSNSTFSSATILGAMSPTIMVYSNYFIICFQSVFTTTDSYTGVTGTCIALSCFYSPAIDGMTVPATYDGGTNWPKLGGTSTYPWYANIIGTPPSGFVGYPFHYYDVASNNVGYCIAGYGQSYATGTLVTSGIANSGLPNLCSLAGNGATPSPTANSINVRAVAATSGIPPTYSGPAPCALATATGSQQYVFGTPTECHFHNPFLNQDAVITLPAQFIAPYGATAPTGPITTGFYNLQMYISNGTTTYVFSTSGGNIVALVGTYTNSVDGFFAAPVQPGNGEFNISLIYSRMVFYTDPITQVVHPCAWLAQPGTFGQMVFARLDGVNQPPYARAFYLRYSGTAANRHASNIFINASGQYVTSMPVVQSVADSVTTLTQVTLAANSPQMLRIPQGVLLTGSDTRYYDGATLHSAGWLSVPITVAGNPASSSSGGTLVVGQTYTYFFVYADFDSYGNAIYSSPSIALTVTIATSNNAATFGALPTPVRSSSLARLLIYRNCVGTGAAVGTQYYRVAQFALTTAGAAATNLTIIPTTWIDTTAENCTGNPLLYSPPNGGELPNDPAPPSTCGVATKSRIFLASAEVGSWLYPSKPFYPGRAPEFNAGQFLDIDPSSGSIVGLAAMDENIVIFKFDRIYVLSGNGPDATGNGGFNLPQNVSTDVGLKDPNSILATEDGVYFRSTRGLQLLNRSLQLEWVGQEIDGLLTGNTILAAVLDPPTYTVRFALSNGSVLVYDYTQQAWSVYQYAFATGNYITSMAMDPTQTRLWMAWRNGSTSAVAYEPVVDQTAFKDAGNSYTGLVQSPYIPMSGPQGWGRARRCNIYGTVNTASAVLSVTFTYDEGMVSSTPITFTLPSTVGPFAARIRLPRQVCRSVAVTISSSGATDDCVITGIELETQIKSSASRTPDSASI